MALQSKFQVGALVRLKYDVPLYDLRRGFWGSIHAKAPGGAVVVHMHPPCMLFVEELFTVDGLPWIPTGAQLWVLRKDILAVI